MTLETFFQTVPRAAAAFSGGTDSAFLLWAAKHCGCDIRAYYVKTAFQPDFELADARRLCRELSIPLTVLEADILAVPGAAASAGDNRTVACPPRRTRPFCRPLGNGLGHTRRLVLIYIRGTNDSGE